MTKGPHAPPLRLDLIYLGPFILDDSMDQAYESDGTMERTLKMIQIG